MTVPGPPVVATTKEEKRKVTDTAGKRRTKRVYVFTSQSSLLWGKWQRKRNKEKKTKTKRHCYLMSIV